MSTPDDNHSRVAEGQAVPLTSPVNALLHGIQPPGKLNITTGPIAETWKTWKQVWNNYSVISSLATCPEEFRVALFLHCIGPDALKVYNGLPFATKDERRKLDTIIERFDEYAQSELNETYERYKFNSRMQEDEENIDAYVVDLRTLAKNCGFCE